MSSTQYRDLWARGKQASPQQTNALKKDFVDKMQDGIVALREGWRGLSYANSFADFYASVDQLAEITRALSHLSHQMKFACDWGFEPQPEFNDHFVNQFFLLREYRRTFWLEGAIFCGLGLEPGGRILELCCGSGYYTDLFYSPFASEIVAVDFDPRAIEMANRFHRRPNVRYEVMDIRAGLPPGPFGTVIWDGAIEHFSAAEIAAVMQRLRGVMSPGARLLGYTIAEPADAPQHPDHETHFTGLESLGAVLKPHFKNVRVFERVHPTLNPPRHNLFFWASDGSLPFDPEWAHGIRL